MGFAIVLQCCTLQQSKVTVRYCLELLHVAVEHIGKHDKTSCNSLILKAQIIPIMSFKNKKARAYVLRNSTKAIYD